MEIPFRSEVRTDTGLYNAKLGMWLFLAAETMFFGALYSSYAFLRVANSAWSAASTSLPLHLSFLSMVCMAAAAVSTAHAWSLLRGDTGRTPAPWLGAATAFGIISVVLIGLEQRGLLAQGLSPASSNFFGMYYVLTGLHRVHLLGLVLVSLYLLVFMRRGLLRDATRYAHHVECVGLFWQFLAVHWAVLITAFYLF